MIFAFIVATVTTTKQRHWRCSFCTRDGAAGGGQWGDPSETARAKKAREQRGVEVWYSRSFGRRAKTRAED